jgi:hypothetical protein
MGTVITPPATTPPVPSKLQTILSDILTYTEIVTEVAAAVPGISGLATIALNYEKIAQAALAGLSASSGQTVAQVIAQLHQETPVP